MINIEHGFMVHRWNLHFWWCTRHTCLIRKCVQPLITVIGRLLLKISLPWNFCIGITGLLRLPVTSGDHPAQILGQIAHGCVQVLITSKTGPPWPLWATCSHVWPPSLYIPSTSPSASCPVTEGSGSRCVSRCPCRHLHTLLSFPSAFPSQGLQCRNWIVLFIN